MFLRYFSTLLLFCSLQVVHARDAVSESGWPLDQEIQVIHKSFNNNTRPSAGMIYRAVWSPLLTGSVQQFIYVTKENYVARFNFKSKMLAVMISKADIKYLASYYHLFAIRVDEHESKRCTENVMALSGPNETKDFDANATCLVSYFDNDANNNAFAYIIRLNDQQVQHLLRGNSLHFAFAYGVKDKNETNGVRLEQEEIEIPLTGTGLADDLYKQAIKESWSTREFYDAWLNGVKSRYPGKVSVK